MNAKKGFLIILATTFVLLFSGCSITEIAYSKNDGSKKSSTKYYQYQCSGSACKNKSGDIVRIMESNSCDGVIATRGAIYGYKSGCY